MKDQPAISKTEDVANGILKFEHNAREHVAVGGKQPSDQEMKSDLLEFIESHRSQAFGLAS